MSIRDKIDGGNFASNLKAEPSILAEYNKYKSKIQGSKDDAVLHKPDQVDIVFKNITESESKTYDDYPGSSGMIVTGRTFINQGSHVDNNPQTDDFIQVNHVSYGGQFDTEYHKKVDYIETVDNGKQVIVKKEWIDDKKAKCTEIDSSGFVIDQWTSDSK